MGDVASAYSDGGTIKTNPAPAGVWAFAHVDGDGVVVRAESGRLAAAFFGLPSVTSNLMEFYAALLAVESLPGGWRGELCTDNGCVAERVRNPAGNFRGVPSQLVARWRSVLSLLAVTPVLLGSHPTKDELRQGVGRDGRPVSRFNVLCDAMCREAKSGEAGDEEGQLPAGYLQDEPVQDQLGQ